MTDLDLMIKNLVTTSVDAELGAPRAAPAFQPADRDPAGSVARWRAPAFAAAAVLMLTLGVISAIRHGERPVSTPVAPATHAVPAPSVTSALKPDGVIGAAYPEAGDVPGVVVGPVPKQYATVDGGTFIGGAGIPALLVAGRPYALSFQYVSSLADLASQVLSVTGTNLASVNCPRAFQIHHGHEYTLKCTVIGLPGTTGKLEIKAAAEGGYSSGTWPLRTR